MSGVEILIQIINHRVKMMIPKLIQDLIADSIKSILMIITATYQVSANKL